MGLGEVGLKEGKTEYTSEEAAPEPSKVGVKIDGTWEAGQEGGPRRRGPWALLFETIDGWTETAARVFYWKLSPLSSLAQAGLRSHTVCLEL